MNFEHRLKKNDNKFCLCVGGNAEPRLGWKKELLFYQMNYWFYFWRKNYTFINRNIYLFKAYKCV